LEGDVDREAAADSGSSGDAGLVRVGDGTHDGEAETDALGCGRVESLEGLEEPVEVAARDLPAAVGDG
jgi:hypothetical protein